MTHEPGRGQPDRVTGRIREGRRRQCRPSLRAQRSVAISAARVHRVIDAQSDVASRAVIVQRLRLSRSAARSILTPASSAFAAGFNVVVALGAGVLILAGAFVATRLHHILRIGRELAEPGPELTPRPKRPTNTTRRKGIGMGNIVASEFMTVDGIMGGPGEWQAPYFDDDLADVVNAGMTAAGALLLGRVTYEEFAPFWSAQTVADDPGAAFMNDTPKYFVSSTLSSADWANSVIIDGDLVAELLALKKTVADHGKWTARPRRARRESARSTHPRRPSDHLG